VLPSDLTMGEEIFLAIFFAVKNFSQFFLFISKILTIFAGK